MAVPAPPAAVAKKVTSLIDKALSTHSEEEARTCALMAVKMLRQYDLVVTPKEIVAETTGPAFERAVIATVKRATVQLHAMLEAAEHRARLAEAKIASLERERAHLEEAEHVKDLAGRWMRSRFSASCRRCAIKQDTGTKVWWLGAKKGVLCQDCWWKKTHQRAATG